MDTRADFQRLLDDMDRVIRAKRQELSELEERLESSRSLVGEREASELRQQEPSSPLDQVKSQRELPEQERLLYEQQLERFTEEFSALESINQELAGENGLLQKKLEAREGQLAELNGRCELLSGSLEEVRAANLDLNLRLAKSESELQMQQRLLEKLHKEDEVLMDAFNGKLELFRQAIASRDQELERLEPDDKLDLDSLESVEGGGKLLIERDKVMKIAAAIRDKDTQLELLKAKLNKQLEPQQAPDQESKLNPDREPVTNANELEGRCRMLESELEAKDRQLHLAEFKNHQYEIVMPSKISDLVQKLIQFYYRKSSELLEEDFSETIELLIINLNRLLTEITSAQGLLYKIDQLREDNQAKGLQIERLVRELNRLDAKLNGDQDDHEQQPQAREERNEGKGEQQVSSTPSKPLDMSKLEAKAEAPGQGEEDDGRSTGEPAKQTARDNERESNLNDSNREGDVKVASKQTVGHKLESAADLQPSNHQSVMMGGGGGGGEMIESSINNHEPARPIKPPAEQRQQKASQTDASYGNGEGALEERLRQLEGENELLELAMKEILLSIKWSDGRCCTILIDCPSLERLCQLIEARHIVGPNLCKPETPVDVNSTLNVVENVGSKGKADELLPPGESQTRVDSLLFQLVVLKSELDLVRGQNEQLRVELKVQRRDYVEYLSSNRNLDQDSRCPAALNEVQCQTDDPFDIVEGIQREEKAPIETTTSCRNCDRLHQLINHLLESIERIQVRVQASEDNYMDRLGNLHKLVDVFEKDLSMREKMLVACRRQCHLLLERKLAVESRLELLESQHRQEQSDSFPRKPACRSLILFNNNLTGSVKRQRENEEIIFDDSIDNSSDDTNSFDCN